MLISQRSVRNAAAGAVGAAALAGAMLFGGDATAQAAPAPTPGTSFATFGPHGGPGIVPERPGGGWGHGGGRGHGGGMGHGGWGHGGMVTAAGVTAAAWVTAAGVAAAMAAMGPRRRLGPAAAGATLAGAAWLGPRRLGPLALAIGHGVELVVVSHSPRTGGASLDYGQSLGWPPHVEGETVST